MLFGIFLELIDTPWKSPAGRQFHVPRWSDARPTCRAPRRMAGATRTPRRTWNWRRSAARPRRAFCAWMRCVCLFFLFITFFFVFFGRGGVGFKMFQGSPKTLRDTLNMHLVGSGVVLLAYPPPKGRKGELPPGQGSFLPANYNRQAQTRWRGKGGFHHPLG